MGFTEDLETIMQKVRWWLKYSSQGIWLTNLQAAEENDLHRLAPLFGRKI